MHKALLRRWCDAMLKYQLYDTGDTRLDGGLLCPACMRVHGRSADAILPLVTQWQTDGDERCLHAAEKLFAWSANMRRPDGSMNNDTNSNWNGITVFYANALGETLLWYGDKLPAADRDAWTARFAEMAEYLCQNIERIGGNVNYPITCAYTMALAARLLGAEPFAAKAKQLADFAVTHITADGLLYGEGHPMTAVTPKSCRPVDLGYNAEESLPALILYAELTGDEDVGRAVLRTAREHLNFMLPDGGWDNSFGSRSYKWSWWGSRTSDGCLAGFAALSRHDPVFAAAVQKNLELLNRCTHDGLLYGGPMFITAEEPACIHHTFCHAKSVAALVHDGWQSPAALPKLPSETAAGARYYPTIDTVRIAQGNWRATVTGYDYEYLPGGHPTGGMVSLLWHAARGPVLAGSMDPYRQNEPNNMQMPRWQFDICTTSRIELRRDGKIYCSSNDLTAALTVGENETSAGGRLRTAAQDAAGRYDFAVSVMPGKVTVTGQSEDVDARFILPVISPEGENVAWQDANTVRIGSGPAALTVQADRPLTLPPEYGTPVRFRRLFNPVGGFQSVVLTLPAEHPFTVTLKIGDKE